MKYIVYHNICAPMVVFPLSSDTGDINCLIQLLHYTYNKLHLEFLQDPCSRKVAHYLTTMKMAQIVQMVQIVLVVQRCVTRDRL
jgi:hypothetical protein